MKVKKVVYAMLMFVMSAMMLTGCGQLKDAITSVTSVPSAPAGVIAVPNYAAVTVTWQPVSGLSSLVKYNIYWSATPGVTPSNGTKISDVTSPYTITGLQNGKTYYFIVTAEGVKGESAASAQVSATPSESAAPFIKATVLSYSGGTPPWGSLTMVQVSSTSSDSTTIQNAVVTVNGTNVPFNPANNEYDGNVVVAPGAAVTVNVTLGAKTYTASSTQFTTYPVVTTPAANAVWQHASPNLINWRAGAPTSSAEYFVGILDSTGKTVYPAGDNGPLEVPINTTSCAIPANSLAAGNYTVLVGIGTAGFDTGTTIPVPDALQGSKLILGGISAVVPITVQ